MGVSGRPLARNAFRAQIHWESSDSIAVLENDSLDKVNDQTLVPYLYHVLFGKAQTIPRLNSHLNTSWYICHLCIIVGYLSSNDNGIRIFEQT